MNCPRCGLDIPTGNWQQHITNSQTSALAIPGLPVPNQISSAYRKTPYRKMEMVADVVVPLLQSIVSGVLVGLVFSLCIPLVDGLPWYSGIYMFIVATGLAWGFRLGSSQQTLWVVEEITGQDINNDGYTGKPQRREISIEVREGRSTFREELPGEESLLMNFAAAVGSGQSFSEMTAQATGYGVTNLRALRDIFLKRRWAYWKNPDSPQQGVELTLSGKRILADIAHPPTPPTDTVKFEPR